MSEPVVLRCQSVTENPLTEPTDLFTPEVVAAVTRHMNDDHAADNVVIVRALGGVSDATAATMTTCDAAGITFDVTSPAGVAPVTIAWSSPVTERPQIRAEVAAMYHRACDELGIAPAAGEHEAG